MKNSSLRIHAKDLVELKSTESLKVKVIYADATHPDNHFGQIYCPNAKMWVHKDLAAVVQDAAKDLYKNQGWQLLCLDSLRTVEAQEKMGKYVRDHREQLEEVCRANNITTDDLISSPGIGAHPRGLAIDVQPLDAKTGEPIDMGTAFDSFTGKSSRSTPASAFGEKGEAILRNRKILDDAFEKAAAARNFPLDRLPTEWWDFRATASHYNQFSPLCEADLPASMWMTRSSPCSEMQRSIKVRGAKNEHERTALAHSIED